MLRNTLKNLVAGALYRSGLLSLLLRRKFRDCAVVLTYHRVLPHAERGSTFSHDAIIVDPEVFERHIATLTRHFDCVDLAEFATRLESRGFSGRPCCLITFDDAWRDNHTHAFPVLRRWNAPAVIFVPVDYIGSGRLFWQERMGHLVSALCETDPGRAREVLARYDWEHLAGLLAQRRGDAVKTAVRAIKHKPYAEIDAMLSELQTALGGAEPDYGPDRYLEREQIGEMAQHRIAFQSHGCSHRIFTRLDADELVRELEDSSAWLESALGRKPIALAYPNGDHDARVIRQTARAGYRLAFTTVGGYVRSGDDALTIKRININDNAAGNEARLLLTVLMSG